LDLASVMGFRGEYASTAAASERASAIAQQIGDTTGAVLADRRMGMILLRLGRLEEAQRCFERVIHSPLYRQDGVLPSRGHSGERAMARAMLARALWLRGFSQRALQEAQASLGEVGGSDHQLTMCRVLLYGMGRVAPMTGEFAAAETAISSILESATSAAAPFWTTAGQFLRGKLLVERHQFAEGLADLREAFDTCNQTGWRLSYPEFMGSLALALAGLGRLDEAHDGVCKRSTRPGKGKTTNNGMSLNCFGSRVRCCCGKARIKRSRRRKPALIRRRRWRASRAPCSGNCASLSALHACE